MNRHVPRKLIRKKHPSCTEFSIIVHESIGRIPSQAKTTGPSKNAKRTTWKMFESIIRQ